MMKKKSLTLKDIQISYDTSTGGITITSRDPRVKGKPFQLKLSANSSTYETLMELLKSNKLVEPESIQLARRLFPASIEATDMPMVDPRANICIGETFREEKVSLKLFSSPNTLIVGGAGSGKSVLQRTIIAHGLRHEEIEVWGVDLKKVELSPYFKNDEGRFATTLDETIGLLGRLESEVKTRYEELTMRGLNSALETEMKAIYLIVDELGFFVPEQATQRKEDRLNEAKKFVALSSIESLVKLGRAAGVYIFLGSQRSYKDILSMETLGNFGTRILMGKPNPFDAHNLLVERLKFGGELLTVHGRGIIEVYGEQKLFQSFFFPQEALSS